MPRFFRVHPSIGIARVGNSPNEFFLGPERPGVPANYHARSGGFLLFKDPQGRIKRQAARFRVWEYQLRGGRLFPLREVTPGADGIVSIVWTVQLANRKAAFHAFDGRDGAGANGTALRDPKVASRGDLVIDPAPQSIEGLDRGPIAISLEPGVKPNIPIRTLGELRTDERGNLLALGGHGESRSVAAPGTRESFILDDASNDPWFDDMSDGPVTAVVDYRNERGRLEEADADPAWLLVGPPDVAPPVDTLVRLWDTMWDLAVRHLTIPDQHALYDGGLFARLKEQKRDWDPQTERFRTYQPSYTQEIRPILQRVLGASQVHDPEATRAFHPNFFDERADERLATIGSDEGEALRDYIFKQIRDPAVRTSYDEIASKKNPEARTAPNRLMSVTRVQYALLRQWVDNKFLADWKGSPPGPRTLAATAITPDGLDYAALENAAGAPFFPGIDVSWMVRQQGLCIEPFRLAPGARPFPELAEPRVGPGFFSQQMAIPW